jgi:hypothetical protein
MQEALAQSSSGLSLEAFGEEDRAPKVPVETQVATLEPYQPVGDEDVAEYGKVSSQAEIYQQIFMQARRLNYNISDLEVVLVGQRNQGKSSLLQAVLGVPIAIGRTRRSFHFHLVNDPSISTPRYIIKENFKETKCTLEQLQQELSKRNRARSDPVTLVIEYKWGFDLTIVDTPPIRSLEELAVWARPAMTGTANRFLVAVEAAKPIKDILVLQWLKHFDPSFSRSMLVLTGFDHFLASFQANPRKALIPFGEMERAPCFWMSLPSFELAKESSLDANLFKRRVWQHHKRDLEALRLLDLDYSANAGQLGIYTFRKHLDTVFKTDLHRHLPSLTRAFEMTIANHEKSLATSSASIAAWNTDNIRAMATTYTNTYLRRMDALIKGSVAGTPKKNGQTLQEEVEDFSRWDSSSYEKPQSFGESLSSANTHAVPHANVKLYGAPQLLRLLDEFKITASQVEMPTVESTELIGSLDTSWAASEIARRKIETQFVPLLEHLMGRTFFIMRRMTVVCDSVVEGQANAGQKLALNQKNFPAFSTFLRQSYIAAQAQALQDAHAKSKEEFCTSLTIYWELTEGLGSFDQNKDSNERLKNITKAAKSIYAKIKERLIEAFILNVQTYFLSATAVLKFSKSVAADVSTLNATTIKDMFVLDQIKDIHQSDIQTVTAELKAIKDLETVFLSKLVPALKI